MRPVRGITTHPLSRFGLGLLASAVAAATNAQVEEPSNDIEQVEVIGKLSEYSATKFNAPIIETARSISIETASQFIDKGAINLSQTTTYMAGVTGETYGFATRGDWIRIRGLEVPRYRDSIQEVFGSYNNSRADIYTLEQVEVLKGPASVLYGQGSPGGIVNYVSKTPKPEAAHQIALEWGNYQRRQLAVDSTGAIGDSSFNYRLVALYRDSDTQVDYVDERVRIVMPSISYAPSGATEVTLIGMKQSSDSDTGSQFVPYVGTAVPLADGS
ncbi:MAG: TonB-dependent receptor plug domain-containing protein, partial [Cellvibrionaceae bacterium]|nr:TonB-dependent receptor plug domain-containing protein [Cellvibrionaceae bacterium]